MKRILCLWLPNWPIQRRLIEQPELRSRPLVLHEPIGGKPRVTACSRSARRQGVRPGMLLAEAEALCWHAGDTCREAHDRRADRDSLRRLAIHCQRFTPVVGLDESESADGLLLDVTGCGYGFGGIDGLANAAVTELQRQGYWATAGMADTVGAAWAVAHYGDASTRVRIVPPGEHEAALRPLPIEALRLSADTIALLHDFDICRIEQLLALPRRTLPCRFGPDLLHRLDQALGAAAELIEPERQDDPIQASWPFDPPIADARLLDQTFEYLLDRLLERVRATGLGVQRMLCSLTLANGEPVHISVGLVRPSVTFAHLMDLLRLHLERMRVTAEIAEAALFVPSVAPLEFSQVEMFDGLTGSPSLAGLLERLAGRLGDRAVLRPRLRADAQPELAWEGDSALDADSAPTLKPSLTSGSSRLSLDALARPTCLKPQPVAVAAVSVVPGGPPLRFEWNRRTFTVADAWGPERIDTGWWRGDDIRREYYQVATSSGERYWLFRRLPDERWFLHGVFA